jgi:hypothetical protein
MPLQKQTKKPTVTTKSIKCLNVRSKNCETTRRKHTGDVLEH